LASSDRTPPLYQSAKIALRQFSAYACRAVAVDTVQRHDLERRLPEFPRLGLLRPLFRSPQRATAGERPTSYRPSGRHLQTMAEISVEKNDDGTGSYRAIGEGLTLEIAYKQTGRKSSKLEDRDVEVQRQESKSQHEQAEGQWVGLQTGARQAHGEPYAVRQKIRRQIQVDRAPPGLAIHRREKSTRPVEKSYTCKMTLNFPNASRSYDPAEGSIRFWGHDGALEVSFFVEEGALRQFAPGASDGEVASLKIFDANREQIFKAARTVYSQRRRGSYALAASDF
jgi:hypothetical protein